MTQQEGFFKKFYLKLPLCPWQNKEYVCSIRIKCSIANNKEYVCSIRCSIRIKCKTLHYQIRTVITGSYSRLQTQCCSGLRRGTPGTLTGLIWPTQPHPGPFYTPGHGPGLHPGQPGAISLRPGGTTWCESSHASWVDPVNAGCSLSPVVSLVPALFASGWPPWFITCPVGAVGEPHDQPQFCFWTVQSALTTPWTKIQQKLLKMPHCPLILI